MNKYPSIKKLIYSNLLIILSTFFTLFFSILFSEFFIYAVLNKDIKSEGLALLLALITFIFFLGSIIFLLISLYSIIKKSLKNDSKINQLLNIGISYCALILIFTSFNYSQIILNGYFDVWDEHKYYLFLTSKSKSTIAYRVENNTLKTLKIRSYSELYRRHNSIQAFKGIKTKTWYQFDPLYTNNNTIFPVNLLNKYHNEIHEFNPEFNQNSRFPIFIDSLYFSVITITGLGYGDISPNTVYTKLMVILEVLLGTFLMIFAIGLALNNTDKPTKKYNTSRFYRLKRNKKYFKDKQ